MNRKFLIIIFISVLVSSCAGTQRYKAHSSGTLQMIFVCDEKTPEYKTIPDKQGLPVFVEPEIQLTSRDVESSSTEIDSIGRSAVFILFTKSGAARFSEITSNNIGRKLAVIVGGICITAPVIPTRIPDGNAQISGDFTAEEADALAREIAGQKPR
jgi:preprotein translocase subunit SecD